MKSIQFILCLLISLNLFYVTAIKYERLHVNNADVQNGKGKFRRQHLGTSVAIGSRQIAIGGPLPRDESTEVKEGAGAVLLYEASAGDANVDAYASWDVRDYTKIAPSDSIDFGRYIALAVAGGNGSEPVHVIAASTTRGVLIYERAIIDEKRLGAPSLVCEFVLDASDEEEDSDVNSLSADGNFIAVSTRDLGERGAYLLRRDSENATDIDEHQPHIIDAETGVSNCTRWYMVQRIVTSPVVVQSAASSVVVRAGEHTVRVALGVVGTPIRDENDTVIGEQTSFVNVFSVDVDDVPLDTRLSLEFAANVTDLNAVYGYDVSLNADQRLLAVSAIEYRNQQELGTGRVHVYRRDNAADEKSEWRTAALLRGDYFGAELGAEFGHSVSFGALMPLPDTEMQHLAVGCGSCDRIWIFSTDRDEVGPGSMKPAMNADNSSVAGVRWDQLEVVTYPLLKSGQAPARFGASVALSRTTVVVGAPMAPPDSEGAPSRDAVIAVGAAFLFDTNTMGVPVQRILIVIACILAAVAVFFGTIFLVRCICTSNVVKNRRNRTKLANFSSGNEYVADDGRGKGSSSSLARNEEGRRRYSDDEEDSMSINSSSERQRLL